jgi:hypothetical protein
LHSFFTASISWRAIEFDSIYDNIFDFYNSGLFEYLVRLTLFLLMFSLGLNFTLQLFLLSGASLASYYAH